MRLYSGTTTQFIEDNTLNQISEKLRTAFQFYFKYSPSPSEVNSWRNSLKSLANVFQYSRLDDNGVILEYQLPLSSKRIDCIVCGEDRDNNQNAVLVELKQWDRCERSNLDNEVATFVGGAVREILHPSVQVNRYQMYLQDCHTAFHEENPVNLQSCAYLHNYFTEENDPLLDSKFEDVLNSSPIFFADDVSDFSEYLKEKLHKGNGTSVLSRIENSKYKASKKLLEHVGNIIKNKPEYVLLDEQLVAYDKVLEAAKSAFHNRHKEVIIIKGGPGTGKSVIALNLLADLSLKQYNTHYATGSRAFTETLRQIIGSRGSQQCKYFNSYVQAELNDIDVLICDEAHRIRQTSNNRFTKQTNRSNKLQIEELIDASKVSVFLIDDKQNVRPDEIGSTELIRNYAKLKNCRLNEFELEAQFRCNGSDNFMNWVNNTLGIHETPNKIWNNREEFDFQIFDSPFSLEKAINEKKDSGFSARLTAGFCWGWSEANKDGTLVPDVKIGNFARPWNAKPESKVRLAPNIPKAPLWAYDPNGINQIGCVYTAQGFEFDYVGVIFGEDLVFDFSSTKWRADISKCADPVVKRSKDHFTDLIKNTYRVLLSRGLKGCYVYFMDKNTENFFKSRMNL